MKTQMNFYNNKSDWEFAEGFYSTEYKKFTIYFETFSGDLRFIAYRDLKTVYQFRNADGSITTSPKFNFLDSPTVIKIKQSVEFIIQCKEITDSLKEMKKIIDAYNKNRIMDKRFLNPLKKRLYTFTYNYNCN